MLLSPERCYSSRTSSSSGSGGGGSSSSKDHLHENASNAVVHPTLPTPFKGEGAAAAVAAAVKRRELGEAALARAAGRLAATPAAELRSQWLASTTTTHSCCIHCRSVVVVVLRSRLGGGSGQASERASE